MLKYVSEEKQFGFNTQIRYRKKNMREINDFDKGATCRGMAMVGIVMLASYSISLTFIHPQLSTWKAEKGSK